MKEVNEMPTDGQFIVLWEFDDLPWSMICKWNEDKLTEYDQVNDIFVERDSDIRIYDLGANEIELRYFIKG